MEAYEIPLHQFPINNSESLCNQDSTSSLIFPDEWPFLLDLDCPSNGQTAKGHRCTSALEQHALQVSTSSSTVFDALENSICTTRTVCDDVSPETANFYNQLRQMNSQSVDNSQNVVSQLNYRQPASLPKEVSIMPGSPPPYSHFASLAKEASERRSYARRTPPPPYSLATRTLRQNSNSGKAKYVSEHKFHNGNFYQECENIQNLISNFRNESDTNQNFQNFPEGNLSGPSTSRNACDSQNHNFEYHSPGSSDLVVPCLFYNNSRNLTPSPPTDDSDASGPSAPVWSDPESPEELGFITADRRTGFATNYGEEAAGRHWHAMQTPHGEGAALGGRQSPVNDGGWRAEVLLPADPREWNEEHISRWIEWIGGTFPLSPIRKQSLPTNGRDLCGLTLVDLYVRTGDMETARVMHTHLSHRMKASGHVSPLQRDACIEEAKRIVDVDLSDCNSTKEMLIKCFGNNKTIKKSAASKGGGQIHLWQFLLDVLFRPNEYDNIISWDGNDGEFRLIDPEEVAHQWGIRKFKSSMNYDKLSRALRYYYDKAMLSKVPSKRYTYKFHLKGLLKACQPSGVSDTCFIQPGFDLGGQTLRNFNIGGD